jgi:hypothetical protein
MDKDNGVFELEYDGFTLTGTYTLEPEIKEEFDQPPESAHLYIETIFIDGVVGNAINLISPRVIQYLEEKLLEAYFSDL